MNKYKSLALNTIIFGIGTFGSKILMLFLTRLYSAHMTTATFGSKEILETTAYFIMPVISFSITDAILRYGLDEDCDDRMVFSTGCAVELFGVILLVLLSPLLSMIPFVKGYTPLLIIYICTSNFRQTCSNFVRARGFVKLFAIDGIVTSFTFFMFNLLFIAKLDLGIKGFFLATISSDLLSCVLLWIFSGIHRYFGVKYVNTDIMKTMLRYSLPLIPTTVMWTITGSSDRIFVKYMKGPEGLTGASAAGIYAASAKVPNLIYLVTSVFFQAWNMSAITESNKKGVGHFYEKVFDSYQSIIYIASAFLILLMQPISTVLLNFNVHPEYREVFKYTPGLIISVLYMCLNVFLSSVYSASQHTKNSFWTSLAATAVNTVFNIILIRFFGIQGAVIATFISYLVCYLIRIVDTRRYIYFKVDHKKTVVNTLFLFAMCLISIIKPFLYVPALILIAAFITLINFDAVMATAVKLLSRKK